MRTILRSKLLVPTVAAALAMAVGFAGASLRHDGGAAAEPVRPALPEQVPDAFIAVAGPDGGTLANRNGEVYLFRASALAAAGDALVAARGQTGAGSQVTTVDPKTGDVFTEIVGAPVYAVWEAAALVSASDIVAVRSTDPRWSAACEYLSGKKTGCFAALDAHTYPALRTTG